MPAIPEARGYPLVGNIPALLRDVVGCLKAAVDEHGPLVHVRLGPATMTVVAHPEDLKRVLQERGKQYIRGRSIEGIRPLLGNGLPLSDGEFWLRQRRTMQPAFAKARVAATVPAIAGVAGRYLAGLRAGEVIETHHVMMRITRDVIMETMFSDARDSESATLDVALSQVDAYIARYAFLPVRVPLWWPIPDNDRFRRAIAAIDGVLAGLVARRRAEGPGRGDLLDGLLAADPETGRGMSASEIRDEVMNIFYAGHETSANLLTWLTLELTRHPEVLDRLRAEVDAVLGGRVPTAEDIPRLEYTLAVLRETLRLHPVAWIFAREATEADELRGHPIPAGTRLMLFPYATHRLPEFWSAPLRFDPERFIRDPGLASTRSCVYMPFGAGPHMCIGAQLALTEAAIVAAMLAQRGALVAVAPETARHHASATLHVKGGLPARFVAR